MSSPSENSNQPKPETANQSESPKKSQAVPKDPILVTILFHIEGLLKILFIPIVFVVPWYSNHTVAIICVLGILRQCKIPKFTKEWGYKLITNEFTQNLFYIVPFLFFPGSNHLVYYLPLAIHFWLGFCQYVFMKHPVIYNLLKDVIDFTRRNDRIIKIQKAKLEVLELVFIIIFAIAGKGSIVIFLLYGNFLRIKYSLNQFTQIACAEMNSWLDQITKSPSCPGVVKTLVEKFRSLCGYLVKM